MVLLEAALAIPLLLLAAIAGLGVVRLGIDELAVVAVARDAALAAGRGSGDGEVRALVQQRVAGAEVSVRRAEDTVEVQVRAAIGLAPLLGGLSVHHEASATAPREPAW